MSLKDQITQMRSKIAAQSGFATSLIQKGGMQNVADFIRPIDYSPYTFLKGTEPAKYAKFRGWVHSVVNIIADHAARQPIKLGLLRSRDKPKSSKIYTPKLAKSLSIRQKRLLPKRLREKSSDSELKILQDVALLHSLENPNPLQTSHNFLYMLIANLCLTGWAACVSDMDEDGTYRFYAIPSKWLVPDHSDGPFSKFYIRNPRNTEANRGEPLDRSQVMLASLPDPEDILEAKSLADAQDRAVKIDDYIQQSQSNFFENGIFPSVIITVGSNPLPDQPGGTGPRPMLTPKQRREVHSAIRRVSQGVGNYGEPAIIDGLIEKIERLSATQVEMGWEKSENAVRSRILSSFGVHPFILGEQSPGSYAQMYIVESRFFARINTFLASIGEMISQYVQAMEDEDLQVWYEELESEDPSLTLQKWNTARQQGDVTQNEYRAEVLGLPPDEDDTPEILPKNAVGPAMQLAAQVRQGQLDIEQGLAILEGLGVESGIAKKIIGEGPPEPDPNQAAQMQGMEGLPGMEDITQPGGKESDADVQESPQNAPESPNEDTGELEDLLNSLSVKSRNETIGKAFSEILTEMDKSPETLAKEIAEKSFAGIY